MSEKKEWLFVCAKEPELSIVIKKDTVHAVSGAKSKPIYARFVKGPYGGECRVSDPEIAKAIRERPRFVDGSIVEVEDWEEYKKGVVPSPEVSRVVAGALSTPPRAPQTVAPPEGTPPAPGPARIPGAVPAKEVAPKDRPPGPVIG